MKYSDQKGQSLVEFAIVLPFLLILLLGTVEFTIALYDKAVISNASREGARLGIVAYPEPDKPRATNGEIIAAVQAYCSTHLVTFSGSSAVTVTPQATGGTDAGAPLSVSVQYNYGFLLIPNFVNALPNPLPIHATTVMRFE